MIFGDGTLGRQLDLHEAMRKRGLHDGIIWGDPHTQPHSQRTQQERRLLSAMEEESPPQKMVMLPP